MLTTFEGVEKVLKKSSGESMEVIVGFISDKDKIELQDQVSSVLTRSGIKNVPARAKTVGVATTLEFFVEATRDKDDRDFLEQVCQSIDGYNFMMFSSDCQ